MNNLNKYGKNAIKLYEYLVYNSNMGCIQDIQQTQIAKDLGLSRFNVCKYLKILEDEGMISNVKQRYVRNVITINDF